MYRKADFDRLRKLHQNYSGIQALQYRDACKFGAGTGGCQLLACTGTACGHLCLCFTPQKPPRKLAYT